ncbi:hypothetical protein BH11ACT3_BH11ACT3_07970 [soil metagenome]
MASAYSDRMSDWQGRLAVFDLETTGVDVDTSRIVSACIAVLEADGSVVTRWDWLADPGIEIPEGASAVHGITTERAREEGRPAATVVAEITQTLRTLFGLGLPVVVYNAPYDLSLLDRECRRNRLTPIETPAPVIDPLVIDKAVDRYRKGKRTLVAAAERYGVSLEDAHDAGADAIAAGRVAQAIARAFPDELDIPLADLHGRQEIWYREQAASFQEYIRTSKGDESYVADASWPLRPLDDPMAFEDTQPIPVPAPRPGAVPILDFSQFNVRALEATPVSARAPRVLLDETVVDLIAEDDAFEMAEFSPSEPVEVDATDDESDEVPFWRANRVPAPVADDAPPVDTPPDFASDPWAVEPTPAQDAGDNNGDDDNDNDDDGDDDDNVTEQIPNWDLTPSVPEAAGYPAAEPFPTPEPESSFDWVAEQLAAPPADDAEPAPVAFDELPAVDPLEDEFSAAVSPPVSSAPPTPRPVVLRIAAAIVTDADGRSLLVRKAGSTQFMQPGGKIEPGESALATLTRELNEELGLVVDPGETEYIGSFRAVAANEENTIIRAEVFFLTTPDEPVANAEIEELLWVERLDDIHVDLAPLSRDDLLPLWAARKPTLF